MPFVISRCVVFTTALGLDWLLNHGIARQYGFIGQAPLRSLSAIFDANIYSSIAARGYSADPNVALQQNYAFFPLYPFLMKLLAGATGLASMQGGYNFAGVLLSNLFFFAALCVLYALTLRLSGDARTASASTWILAALPWAYVFSMTYTESLFLLVSLGTSLAALGPQGGSLSGTRVGWYVAGAGVLAALSTLTRPQGVLVALLAAMLVTRWAASLGGRLVRAALACLPSLIALAGWALVVGRSTGNLTSVFEAKRGWGEGWWTDFPRVFVLPPSNPVWPVDILATFALLTWVILTLPLVRDSVKLVSRRAAMPGGLVGSWQASDLFAAFAVLYFLVTLANTPANVSWGRYMIVVFPVVWVVARFASPAATMRRLIMVCLFLQALLLTAAVLAQATP